jgi:lysophospholipase L1-like esterase
MKSSRETIYAGVLTLVSLALALVLGELGLRALTPDKYYVFPPGLQRTFKPLPDTMPGISGDSRFSINEDGVRGPSFSDEDAFRILAVGGSTTECLYLDQAEAWPQVLQDMLNAGRQRPDIWVGNVGKSGHDTRHNRLQVERLLDQYPRIDVVVLLEGVNDMRFWLNSFDNEALAAERYVTNETVLDQAFATRPGRTVEFVRRGDEQGWHCVSCDEPFYKRTEVWRRLRTAKRAYFGSGEEVIVQDEAGDIYITQRRRRRDAVKEERLPDLARGRAAYARNLEGIIDAAQSRGTRVVFMTQPSIWRDDLPAEHDALLFMGGPIGGDFYDTAQKREAYYSVGVLADAMKQYNDEMLRVCESRGVPCLDLASQIPKDTSSLYDDVHFNEAGASKVARALADFLKKSHIF